jgi:hypothetical protein
MLVLIRLAPLETPAFDLREAELLSGLAAGMNIISFLSEHEDK